MRVLYVSPESPLIPQAGGIATYIGEALRALRSAGHEVALLSWGPPSARTVWVRDWLEWLSPDRLFWYEEVPEWWREHPGFSRTQVVSEQIVPVLRQALDAFQPDIIEVTDYHAPLFAFLERVRAGLERQPCPVVVFHHGLSLDTWINDAQWPGEEDILEDFHREVVQLRWADMVLCPSETAQRRLLELGIVREKMAVVREPFTFPVEQKVFSTSRTKWAHLGRFTYRKGADALIYHLNQILGTPFEPTGLRILGEAGPSTFREIDFWERYQTRVPPEWHINTECIGAYLRESIGDLLSDVRFVAQFSRFETFGYTTVETIAHGAIPLMARGSAMAELVPAELASGLLSHVYADQQELLRVLKFWSDDFEGKRCLWRSTLVQWLHPDQFAQSITRYYTTAMGSWRSLETGVLLKRFTSRDVTVLIPHRDDFVNLLSCLESIYGQTQTVAEIILVDDGSLPEIQQELDALRDLPRLRILLQNNQGLCATRNRLINACRTPWAVFLDSDDRLAPEFVERCLTCVESAHAVIPRRQNFGDNSNVYPQTTIGSPLHWVYNHFRMTALIQTACLRSLRFDPDLRHGEADDWDFWLRFTMRGYQAVTYPAPLFLYHMRSGSMSWPWSTGQALRTEGLLQKRLSEARLDAVRRRDAELGGLWRSLLQTRRLADKK